jgi:hypothetical protein
MLKDRLRILVSSSLEPLANASAIYVLDRGSISESGTFPQLKAAGGAFSRQLALSREQMAGATSLAAAPAPPPPIQPAHTPLAHTGAVYAGTGHVDTEPSDQGDGANPSHAVLCADAAERAAASCEVRASPTHP